MLFSQSLKSNRSFRRLYSKGRSAGAKTLVLYCRGNGSAGNRLGITVSAKLAGAVGRNRIRRRIREIYRTNEARFKPGYDIVAVARHSAAGASYSQMEEDFLRLAGSMGILK
jgi:ribonuclease P protein component